MDILFRPSQSLIESNDPLRILLTGGSGDLGTVLTPLLLARGDTPIRLDPLSPRDGLGTHIPGSILDRDILTHSLDGVECVIHIAAWHGIHEARGTKDATDFWELNVTGTFEVFEAAARAGIRKLVFLSSTSVEDTGIYAESKRIAETVVESYVRLHNMQVITLRPRAFIPHWNRSVYGTYIDWARWFWRGAVHIDDVAQAVLKSLDRFNTGPFDSPLVVTVDGAYDFTDDDFATWDADGPGTTFARVYPEYVDLVHEHGLDPALMPHKHPNRDSGHLIGCEPQYSLRNLLAELAEFGEAGPPHFR